MNLHDYSSSVNNILRNKERVFHHLPLRDMKTGVIEKLFGCDSNKKFLKQHYKGGISTGNLLEHIASVSAIDKSVVVEMLISCYETGLLEFHITDVCDLQCVDCHYVNKSFATIPYDEISRYIKNLRPKAITITGGGEPNTYLSGGKTLNDVVTLIHNIDPAIQLGLINNNTHIPDGEWLRHISWQRTSIDAAKRETYFTIKGRDKYELCVQNVYKLLDSPIPFVGVGFLYRKENISELADFLQEWYARFSKMSMAEQMKFNIQLRPISPAIEHTDAVCRAIKSFTAEGIAGESEKNVERRICDIGGKENKWICMEQKMEEVVRYIKDIAAMDSGFSCFLDNSTNFFRVNNKSGSYFLHERKQFSKCYNSLLHRVLRSDGCEYPDFLLCNFPEKSMGNVLEADDRQMERIRIALNSFYYHLCYDEFCNPSHCRQGWVSGLIERYDAGEIKDIVMTDSKFF